MSTMTQHLHAQCLVCTASLWEGPEHAAGSAIVWIDHDSPICADAIECVADWLSEDARWQALASEVAREVAAFNMAHDAWLARGDVS